MALPTFLGIGVPRAGTTWLHELLGSHPDIYVPARRKELSFFDLHYDRGVQWYEKFFPQGRRAETYRAIGEITPYYYYGPSCPQRIADLGVRKLLLILRNPVDRAWSYYGQKIRNGMFQGSFEEFLAQSRWPVVDQGRYNNYLRNYLRHFDRDQILILIFEHALADLATTKRSLANFLEVSAAGFEGPSDGEAVNASYVPRAPGLYGVVFRIAKMCREYDLDWVVNAAKRLGLREAFGTSEKLGQMGPETRAWLEAQFHPDVLELESMLGLSLDVWRKRSADPNDRRDSPAAASANAPDPTGSAPAH